VVGLKLDTSLIGPLVFVLLCGPFLCVLSILLCFPVFCYILVLFVASQEHG
jgi:hypothetical protein